MQLESISTSPDPTAGFRILVGQIPLASLMVERECPTERRQYQPNFVLIWVLIQGPW